MSDEQNILQPESWVKNYSDYLYNYALYRVNNKELAKDLVQDTFISALSAISGFEGRSNEKTWLVSILKRKIIDHFRKASTRKEKNIIDKNFSEGKEDLPFQTEGEMKGTWKQDRMPRDWNIKIDEALENEELAKVLRECIKKLPEKWGAVFTLRMIEEMESDDICKELDITSSNLWVILHRSRLHLRECVEKNWFN